MTADFLWQMEMGAEPYAPKRPVVGFDARRYAMVADVSAPLPAASGRARRQDDAYERRGVCKRVVLVNLSCHMPVGLYRVLSVAQARWLGRRLALLYTLQQASGLNRVEIEVWMLLRQCLGQRLWDIACVRCGVAAWAASGCGVAWRFGVWEAGEKWRCLYPKELRWRCTSLCLKDRVASQIYYL